MRMHLRLHASTATAVAHCPITTFTRQGRGGRCDNDQSPSPSSSPPRNEDVRTHCRPFPCPWHPPREDPSLAPKYVHPTYVFHSFVNLVLVSSTPSDCADATVSLSGSSRNSTVYQKWKVHHVYIGVLKLRLQTSHFLSHFSVLHRSSSQTRCV
jgi:hypothetical protein